MRVPRAQGPTVQRTALRAVTQSTPDVSSGLRAVGQGLGQVAQVADRVAMQQVEIEANTADTEITGRWLEWDTQARRDFQGNRVEEYEPAAAEWWEKTREEYSQRLSPAARLRLGQALERRRVSALGSVGQHAAAVRERHAIDTYDAAQNTRITFAVDTGNVAGARDEIMREAAAFGAQRGWSTEQVQVEQQKRLGMLHLVHITRMAEGAGGTPGDAAAARAYYDAHKAEIPDGAKTRVEQVLAGEKLNQDAKAFAAGVANKPLGEQLEAASGLAGPLRERALLEIRNNNALVRQAEAERKKGLADEAWQGHAFAGRRPPERLLSQLDPADRGAIETYLRQRAEVAAKKAEGKPVRTDPAKLAELLDMATREPEKFKEVRMQALVGKLDDADMFRMTAMQQAMMQPDTQREIGTYTQHIATYTGTFKTPDQKASFGRAALEALEQFRQEKGKAPTFEERRVILDRLAFQEDGWFSKSRFYEVAPNERASWVRSQVPRKDREDIEKELRGRGLPATPENILDLYLAGQRQ